MLGQFIYCITQNTKPRNLQPYGKMKLSDSASEHGNRPTCTTKRPLRNLR